MKKSMLLLASFMLVSVLTFAHKDNNTVQSGTTLTVGPAISWTNGETIDMGKIDKGIPKTVTFEFKNTGTTPVIISSAKGSCGCTNVEFSQQAINPNASGFVKATYNAANVGAFSKTITVVANTSEQAIVLTIKGEVK